MTGVKMSNVIDMTGRLKAQATSEALANMGSAEILNISEIRKRVITEDRRQVKRTILTEFIALHAVVPNKGIMKVTLYDINESGLSFDLESQRGHYNVGELVELRLYLNQSTYLTINTKVAHVTDIADEGIHRHGCGFEVESRNREALSHFVKFLESVTANLKRDGGDLLVSKINS